MFAKLPIDLSTFSELRQKKYLYIDKTKYAYDLITSGRRFFLSRPRRFGKTLFVSTLKEILLGNKELFDDLWIAKSDYNWPVYGLITLDLSTLGIENSESLKTSLREFLVRVSNEYSLNLEFRTDIPELILYDLVKALKNKFGYVALLIDEYDHPILHSPNKDIANNIRYGIKSFFAAIKGLDSEIDFVFITGISDFLNTGVFENLNNLRIL